MRKTKLSAVIIAKNEEELIGDCLKSVKWADEIVLVDSGSTDRTPAIAKRHKAKVINVPTDKMKFSYWRNKGLEKAKGQWILYIDADERVTPKLREEILKAISKPQSTKKFTAFEIPRRNFYLGQEMRFGGAWPDYVKRLFLKKALKGWRGELHERPLFEGSLGRLKNPLIHLTHRDLSSMLEKTRRWSRIEAELLAKAHHPPVVWWRIGKVMLAEFWYRGIKLQGLRDGVVGLIEVVFQMFSRFVTYARLWEIQNKQKFKNLK